MSKVETVKHLKSSNISHYEKIFLRVLPRAVGMAYRLKTKREKDGDIPMALYIVAVVIIIIYGVGYIPYTIQILNLQPRYTFLFPPGSPGVLSSERYTVGWVFYFFLSVKFLFPIFLGLLMLWRKNGICSAIWLFAVVVIMAASALGLVKVIKDRAFANGTGQGLNFASDPLYCCVTENWQNPINQCPNTADCTLPIAERPDIIGSVTTADLMTDPDFVVLFWTTIAYTAVDVIIFIVVLVALLREPKIRNVVDEWMDVDAVIDMAERHGSRMNKMLLNVGSRIPGVKSTMRWAKAGNDVESASPSKQQSYQSPSSVQIQASHNQVRRRRVPPRRDTSPKQFSASAVPGNTNSFQPVLVNAGPQNESPAEKKSSFKINRRPRKKKQKE